ncbi:alpha/beta hydrolase family protein [Kangiella shandongensis]|uniref:alpha/beta hydrolase family protein n=1 Tax=Kangiella shandongensis TaxID=2763258 RepID=UPI001CC11E21|nr:alpha/beta fold hydrolase [Kangiella shandongensis]
MSYQYQEVSFTAADGFELKGALYPAATGEEQSSSTRFLVIGSAFGVPYQYYKHIAAFLADNGISVVTFDYRGISHSQKGNMPADNILMQHWGQLDLEAAIQFVKDKYAPGNLYYMGHSAGGQITGLAPSSVEFDKIVIAASGVGSWRLWPGWQKYGLAAIWYVIFPLVLTAQFGHYFSSKLLGPIPVPKTAVKQWLRWARSEEYLFTPKHGLDISNYAKLKAKLFGLTISDDWYAPQEARDGLLKHYSNCHIETQFIRPVDLGLNKIGHFGLFKKKQEIRRGIWQPILNFLND